MIKLKNILILALAFSLNSFAVSADDDAMNAEKSAVAKVADNLNKALHASDAETVKRLLDKDVQILEGSHAQKSRDEYMKGHMISDMKFLSFVSSKVTDRQISVSGDLAWIITHSQTTGEYKERKIDRAAREMLVMKKGTDNKWRITLVHWGDK